MVTARARRRLRIRSNLLEVERSITTMNRWIPTVGGHRSSAAVFAVPAIRHWRERPPAPAPPPQPLRSAWTAPDGLDPGAGGRLLLWTVARAGWPTACLPRRQGRGGRRCGCRTCATARRGCCLAPTARQCRSGRRTARRSVSSPTDTSARSISRSGTVADLADASSGRGARVECDRAIWSSRRQPTGRVDEARRGRIDRGRSRRSMRPAAKPSHSWPSFLPDGRHVIFLVSASQPSRSGIWIASLDDPSSREAPASPSDAQAIVVGSPAALPRRSRAGRAADRSGHLRDRRPAGGRRTASGARPARTALRDRLERRA